MMPAIDSPWVGGLLILLAPWVFGEVVIARGNWSGTARLGIAILVGQLVLAVVVLGLFTAGLSFVRIVDIVAVVVAMTAIPMIVGRVRSSETARASVAPLSRKPNLLDFVAGACAALLLARIVAATGWAITNGDEFFIWWSKARHFFESDSYFEAVRTISAADSPGAHRISHPDYPSLGPLLQAFAIACVPDYPMVVARFPISLFDLGLLALFHGTWRNARVLPAAVGLFAVFLSSSFLVQDAGADRMMIAGSMCAWIGGTRRLSSNEEFWSMLVFSAGMLIAVWSKNEGQLHFISIAAGIVVVRRALTRNMILASMAPLSVIGIMWAVNRWAGLHNDLVGGVENGGLSAAIERISFDRFVYLARSMISDVVFDFSTMGGVWVLALLVSLSSRDVNRMRSGTWVFVGTSSLGLLFVLATTPYDVEWHWKTSHTRIFLFAIPALAHLMTVLEEPTDGAKTTTE